MKRAKKLYILLGVLAAACLATVIALGVEEYKEQIRTSDAVILEIPPEEVTALSWEYEETSLGFHKEEDTWLYDQDAAFPVDPEKIEGFLERFEAFGVTFVIEDVEDYGQYGLEEPLFTTQITAGDTEYTITLGVLAPWIPSGMCPLGTETPIWWRRTPWRILTRCFPI